MTSKTDAVFRIATLAILLASTGTQLGCKDDASCDAVIDHTLSLMPAEFKKGADRDAMLAKCKEAPPEARECALKAKKAEDLMACSVKHKQTVKASKPAPAQPAPRQPAVERQRPAAATPTNAPEDKPRKIEPTDLPQKLAKLHEGTKGINAPAGQWQKYHKAVIARHGEPTFEKELYGKPAYYWAAREGDVCVKFGYPQPKELKANTWTSWRPSIVQPPAPGLKHGELMFAKRDWNECISYAQGKAPE